MRTSRLAMLVLALALLLAAFSLEASALDELVYFDRTDERVGEGGVTTFNIVYFLDYTKVGEFDVNITVNITGGNATYGTNYTAKIGEGSNLKPFDSDGNVTYSFTLFYNFSYWNNVLYIPIEVTANDSIGRDVYQVFTLNVSGNQIYLGTISDNTLYIDDLPAIQFQAGQKTINEGEVANISVVRSGAGASTFTSSVNFTCLCNLTTGGNFTVSPEPHTLTFALGETVKYINVSTFNDGFFEDDYNVTFSLQNPSDARILNPATYNLTVISTGSTPIVQFRDVSESVDEGGSVNVTLVRTGDISKTKSKVKLSVNPSNASGNYQIPDSNNISYISGDDYEIDFHEGETEKTITVDAGTNVKYDDTHDLNFSLSTMNGGKAIIGSKNTNIMTIVDKTPLPVIEFVTASENIDEKNAVNITLMRTGAANIASTVNIAYDIVAGDTGGNYSVSPKYVIQFSKEDVTANITVTTCDDVIYGNDYHLNFTLSNPDKATIGTNSSNVLTVQDTTPYPIVQFLIDSVSVKEGNTTNLTLVRSGAMNIQSTVSCQYNNELSSKTNVFRFTADPLLSNNIVFSPDETVKTIAIYINPDNIAHQGEIAYFEVHAVNNARIGSMDHVQVGIIDTTELVPVPPDVYFDSAGSSINSGETCQLTIKRSAYDQESNVILNRASGTANAGTDYSTSAGLPYTVHFAVSEKVKTVTVSVNASTEGEKSVVFGLYRSGEDAIPVEPYTYTLNIHGITPPPAPTPTPTPTPTPAPETHPLYVNANLDTDQIIVGYEGKITITVTDGVKPVSGATVSIDKSGGQVILLNPKTDNNGVCYATFKSDNPGTYSLTVTATATGYDPGTATLSTSVITAIPGALTVNAMVKQQPVVIGSEAEVSVNVLDGGTPVPGAAISIETTSGSVTPSSGTTNSDGNMFATFHSGDPGSYIITVTATASGHPASRVSYAVQVVGAEERHLYATMSVNPKSVSPNSNADVTVVVTDGVMPVSNAQVSLVTTGGTIKPASGVTDKDGKFVAQFSAGSEGTYTLGANVFSEEIGQASYSTYIKVKQNMFDMQTLLYFVIAVVLIAIILIILAWIVEKWRAYDLRIIPKMGAIPADGMSRLPVRIELFNGFGRPKKARSDTYIELEATAGRIESATIPSGRNYADAVLMSTKEFGPVTIKAKLGDKAMSSVPVEFKLDGGSLAVTITPGMIIADSKSSASINIRIRNSKGNYVVPLSDKIIEINTNIGDIVGSIINMPARANSANATIVSNREGGIATVTATMGTLKGTGRVEFRSMTRQLCENCGQPIPGNLPVCPSCGKPVASAEDNKAVASMN